MTAKPLTWAQQIVWAGQAILPTVPHYNQAYCCDLKGSVDRDALEAAHTVLCADVDALTLVFDATPSSTVQAAKGVAPPLQHVQLSDRQAAQSWMEARALVPFNLQEATSAFALIEITSQHHVLFVVQHHLVTDGRSAGLLLNALAQRYRAMQNATTCPPTPAYLDLAENLAGPKLSTTFDHTVSIQPMALYGRDVDLGGTDVISLPVEIGKGRADALKALAQQPGFQSFTPLMAMQNILATLLAAWLSRVTAQSEVAFGMPQHNRVNAAQRDVIGLFMEILPLSVTIEPNDTFHTLFDRVTQASREMMINGGPGTTRVDLLRHRNVLLNIFSGAPVDFLGLETKTQIVPVNSADPAHDIQVEFEDLDGAGVFNARIVFDTTRFDAPSRQRAVAHFLALFDTFCADPDVIITSVDILDPQERQAIAEFNSKASAFQQNTSILDVFLAKIGDAPAVRLSGTAKSLSHRELDLASNKMAHLLISKGAKALDHIAIHLPRSPETIIAILAIHKIGAAFVPIEPSLPEQRRDFILSDTDVQIVISNILPNGLSPSEAKAYPDTPFSHRATPEAPAYVIYTSGSTGKPKGVVIGHRELFGYCQACIDNFGMTDGQSYAFFTPFGFDLVMNSLFMPLISGGEIVIYPETESGADLSIVSVFSADEVDFAKPTPSHLRLGVLSAKRPLNRIRTLSHSGEAFPEALARQAHQILGSDIQIINEYGPTEAVVGAMMHRYDPAQPPDGPLVPLGRPLEGMRIYVLSASLAHQPMNVPGEIAIGGRLAHGYLNRAKLTDQRFVPDPYVPGEKMYLTGDLGVFAGPSDLRYLGRLDDQIKINGIRLELGEIEHAIAKVSGVDLAVVSLCTNPAGRPALVAYVEGHSEREAIVSAARSVLPASITLGTILQLDQIPVSANGKINRAALPSPAPADWQVQTTGRAPTGPTEIILAEILMDILGLERISADDDFYDIGGDSLAAVRITNAAHAKGLKLKAVDLFRHRTISNITRNLASTPMKAPKERRQFSRVSTEIKAQLRQALRQPK